MERNEWARLGTVVLLLAASLYVGSMDLMRGQASLHWPSAPGKVWLSDVHHHGGFSFSPDVRYAFQMDGQTYYGSTVKFGNGFSMRAGARNWAEHYPVGARVQVFYDPRKPQISCLEPGNGSGPFTCLVVVPLLLLLLMAQVWTSGRTMPQ
jgi:uncharacterized protein DUF3592